MFKASGVAGSEERAREMALDALKQVLWEECWKEAIELVGVMESVREVGGMFEVTVSIK